jgi:hypothetical protein
MTTLLVGFDSAWTPRIPVRSSALTGYPPPHCFVDAGAFIGPNPAWMEGVPFLLSVAIFGSPRLHYK